MNWRKWLAILTGALLISTTFGMAEAFNCATLAVEETNIALGMSHEEGLDYPAWNGITSLDNLYWYYKMKGYNVYIHDYDPVHYYFVKGFSEVIILENGHTVGVDGQSTGHFFYMGHSYGYGKNIVVTIGDLVKWMVIDMDFFYYRFENSQMIIITKKDLWMEATKASFIW